MSRRSSTNLFTSLSKSIDNRITSCGIFRPMQGRDLMAFSCHPRWYPICCMPVLQIPHKRNRWASSTYRDECATYLTKDNTLSNRQQTVQWNEDIVFLFLGLAVHVELCDVSHIELFLSELYLIGRSEVLDISIYIHKRGMRWTDGANLEAKDRTWSGNVAEKRMIWTGWFRGSMLSKEGR